MTRFAFVRRLWLLPAAGLGQTVGEDAKYTTYSGSIRFADMESVQVVDASTLRLKFEPIPQQSLMLHKNGIVQTGAVDFTTNQNVITLRVPIAPGDAFVAWYRF